MLPFGGDQEAFRRGVWQKDCARMELGDGTDVLCTGAGYIGQRDGSLVFGLYGLRTPAGSESLDPWISSRRLILRATDEDGFEWQADVEPDSIELLHRVSVKAALRELRGRASLPSRKDNPGSIVGIWTYHRATIPTNLTTELVEKLGDREVRHSYARNAAAFDSQGFRFELRADGDSLVIMGTINAADPPNFFEHRVVEALEFALGMELSWSMAARLVGQSISLTLRPLPRRLSVVRRMPPLYFVKSQTLPAVWEIADAYLGHVVRTSSGESHPLSQILAFVRSAADSGPRAYGLALSVGVEELANAFIKSVGVDPRVIELVQRCKKALDAEDDSDTAFQRVIGGLEAMAGQERAKDRLLRMVAEGRLFRDQIDGWETLRNMSVHPRGKQSFTGVRSLLGSVGTLTNCLVFNTIGYSGPFTNYATADLPSLRYPLAVAM